MPAPTSIAPEVQAVMQALRADGKSFHAIAAVLNKLGARGAAGGRWYGATVRRAILLLPQSLTFHPGERHAWTDASNPHCK